MDFIIDAIVEWLKGLLVDGIMGNLDGLFDNVNQSVGEIATQVGTTPADWNAGVFSMIRQISCLLYTSSVPEEHKAGIDMRRDMLRRSHTLIVCGSAVDEDVKNDIAVAGRLGIAATTLEGVLAVKGHGTPGHAGH